MRRPVSTIRNATLAFAGFAAAAAMAGADPAERNPWAEASSPARGQPQAIGGYSAGCVQGAARLPLDGTGFQVMRPSRRRRFGHPDLIAFVRRLGKQVVDQRLGVVLIGDLGQPRGGPATSGHASHQSGLDVDIWYWRPASAVKRRLSRRARETLAPRPVVSAKAKRRTRAWSPHMIRLIAIAAADERVDRIFVNPLVKRELCDAIDPGERGWLRKVRPWWGHDWHFHVRLFCPADSPDCQAQPPTQDGDGCADLAWWLEDRPEADAERKDQQTRYLDKVGARPELPARCADLATAR